MPLPIETLPEADSPAWDAYVGQHPRGSLYHTTACRRVMREQFGHEDLYLVARGADGAIRGVLPVVRQKSLLFGDRGVSVPFFNYGGALGEDAAIEEALMREAAAILGREGVSSIEFRDTGAREGWPARTDKVAMILDLPETMEALGKSIGSKRRSQARRAQRENPELRIGGAELLDGFYAVFAENMRDLGTPVYPRRFFAAMLDTFPEAATLVVVELAGKPVAAAFLLGWGGTLEIPWASTLREVNRISINMYLYWQVLEHAIERGCKHFDFGRSTVDAGTYKFKKQWGAEPQPLHWHYWLPEGEELPRINPDNPKYALLIRAWQKLPVPVANLLGPHIVRNLP